VILQKVMVAIQDALILYFVVFLAGQIVLAARALINISHYRQYKVIQDQARIHPDFLPSITLLVPIYNDQAHIVSFVNSLFQLNYPDYEIIVVDDGSMDGSLDLLIAKFDLTVVQEITERHLDAKPVRATYSSPERKNLRVIYKEQGGRADALNVGINASRNKLICVLDVDLTIEESALKRCVQTFLDSPETLVCGGIVASSVAPNTRPGADKASPAAPVAHFEALQNMRRTMIGDLGWSSLNASFTVPPGFSLFSKEALLRVGGYSTKTVREDMEMIIRLHRQYRVDREAYKITTIPALVGTARAPREIATARKSHIWLQQGLAESLSLIGGLLFSARGGVPGWIAFPWLLAYDWLYPVMEFGGLFFVIVACALGAASPTMVCLFLAVTIGFQIVISLMSILLDEVAFHPYPKLGSLLAVLAFAVAEQLGYRQLCLIWRIVGLIKAAPAPTRPQKEVTLPGSA
jgi:cellulose synthase/poly-beta-1,6-N-acetylglucosamine synthase-like glycosyltransferase